MAKHLEIFPLSSGLRRVVVSGMAGVAGLAIVPVLALQPLHQNERVVNSLYAVGLADEVRNNCPEISARTVKAIFYLRSIAKYASGLGYSDAEIEALTENKVEKERLRARIRADLAKRGAQPGVPEGFCAVGREEIAQDSASGRLLWEK